MTLLSEYYVPGLHIEDRSIKVPLDWTGHEPVMGSMANQSACSTVWSPLPNMCMMIFRCSCSCRVVPVVPAPVRSVQVPMVGLRRPSSISVWCCRINVVLGVHLVSIRM